MFDSEKIEQGVRMVIDGFGDDPDREGLLKTPARVAKMYEEIFAGLSMPLHECLEKPKAARHCEMMYFRDIPFFSMCEHHLAPFFGHIQVACVSGDTGCSCHPEDIARIVDVFARRPQIQERMGTQIADVLMDRFCLQGAFVKIEAEHMCMIMRGVKKKGSFTTTVAARGILDRLHLR